MADGRKEHVHQCAQQRMTVPRQEGRARNRRQEHTRANDQQKSRCLRSAIGCVHWFSLCTMNSSPVRRNYTQKLPSAFENLRRVGRRTGRNVGSRTRPVRESFAGFAMRPAGTAASLTCHRIRDSNFGHAEDKMRMTSAAHRADIPISHPNGISCSGFDIARSERICMDLAAGEIRPIAAY